MYNFEQQLIEDEKILYQGRALVGKGGKNIGRGLLFIGFILFIQVLMFLGVTSGVGGVVRAINSDFIIIFIVTLIFEGIAIYGLVYNTLLKKKATADDIYCLTNKRAFKYEMKKNKLVYGYLVNYQDMKTLNVKHNCGDLYMGIEIQEDRIQSINDLEYLKELMLQPNSENMPNITFESIENPEQILQLAKKARFEELNKMEETKNY